MLNHCHSLHVKISQRTHKTESLKVYITGASKLKPLPLFIDWLTYWLIIWNNALIHCASWSGTIVLGMGRLGILLPCIWTTGNTEEPQSQLVVTFLLKFPCLWFDGVILLLCFVLFIYLPICFSSGKGLAYVFMFHCF